MSGGIVGRPVNAVLGIVPRLLGCWEDPEIYPFRFAAVTRLRGQVPRPGCGR